VSKPGTAGGAVGIWGAGFYVVPNIPSIREGDDLAQFVYRKTSEQGFRLRSGDVVIIGCEAVSRAEGPTICLADLEPSSQALDIARDTGWPTTLCELYLRETCGATPDKPGMCITLSRLAVECPGATGPASEADLKEAVAALPPRDANTSARKIRCHLQKLSGVDLTVVVSDMRPDSPKQDRRSIAIGVSGTPLTVEEAN